MVLCFSDPESPRGLKQISQSTTSVSVSWTSVTDPTTISGYEISIVHGANGLVIASDSNVAAATTSYQFGELEPATQYIVSLQSFLLDLNGTRLASAAISWTVTTGKHLLSWYCAVCDVIDIWRLEIYGYLAN